MPSVLRNIPQNMCAYCGAPSSLTVDHIPAKNLFPKPRPQDLIKVPACKACHSPTSRDDEYFRLKISMRDDVGLHPAARATWKLAFHSLARKEAAGFRTQILLDTKWVNLNTQSGLYLGKRLGYDVDMNRIRRVIERVVRGLYFVEAGRPLGLNIEVRVFAEEDIETLPHDSLEQLKQTILNPLSTLPPRIIGDNIFLYRYQIVKENPEFSVWGLSFYGKVPFLAMTGVSN